MEEGYGIFCTVLFNEICLFDFISHIRAKLEQANAWKGNRELFLVMYEGDDENYERLKAKIESCEGEIDAYYNLLDLLVLFIPEEYKLPEDRNRAFSVKVDVAKFRNLISLLYKEVLGESQSVKSGDRKVNLIEEMEKQLLEKIKGKSTEEIDSMMRYEDGVTSVYYWLDVFLDNMITSYEGGDNNFV